MLGRSALGFSGLLLLAGTPGFSADRTDCGAGDLLRKVVADQGRRGDHPEGFTRTRNLLEYLGNFPPEMGARIRQLGGNGLILEAGAGEAIAAEQLLQGRLEHLLAEESLQLQKLKIQPLYPPQSRNDLLRINEKALRDRPSVIALSKEIEREIPLAQYQGKLKILKGRFFEEVPNGELGRPDLILDSIGVMSYTAEPSKVLRKYLEVLKPDGEIYLYLDRSLREEGDRMWTSANRDRTSIRLPGGETVNLFEWLRSLDGRGIEVQELENSKRFFYEADGRLRYREHRHHSIRIRKTSGPITIPELRLTEAVTRENPPIRFFSVVSGNAP